jgi:hypothetical protein
LLIVRLILTPALLGGCPTTVEPLDSAPVAVEPGSYWVADQDGGLAYFELPKHRGAAGRWIALEEADNGWFSGPAFYIFDDAEGWRRDSDAEGMTLDEAIQLHDPAPTFEL